ncbi:hypothetical protein [Yoonia sp.]|uniref:hypothetical protein n=1 Tax=Yoonia sp. TaxID=2212373 RepID=UPI0025D064C8|nr:hypothetical protein [Yoonia sp.]
MNELNDPGPEGLQNATARVAEISRLFESIRQVLDQMIRVIGTPDGRTPKAIITKLNELQSAHLKVLAAEEVFHAQHGQSASSEDIDVDAIRADIGGQLDRLRAAITAEGLSVAPELCAACRAALSV